MLILTGTEVASRHSTRRIFQARQRRVAYLDHAGRPLTRALVRECMSTLQATLLGNPHSTHDAAAATAAAVRLREPQPSNTSTHRWATTNWSSRRGPPPRSASSPSRFPGPPKASCGTPRQSHQRLGHQGSRHGGWGASDGGGHPPVVSAHPRHRRHHPLMMKNETVGAYGPRWMCRRGRRRTSTAEEVARGGGRGRGRGSTASQPLRVPGGV